MAEYKRSIATWKEPDEAAAWYEKPLHGAWHKDVANTPIMLHISITRYYHTDKLERLDSIKSLKNKLSRVYQFAKIALLGNPKIVQSKASKIQ